MTGSLNTLKKRSVIPVEPKDLLFGVASELSTTQPEPRKCTSLPLDTLMA
jgi:hypothetical protein